MASLQAFDFTKAPGHLVRRLHQISLALFAAEVAAHDVTAVQFAILQILLDESSVDQITVAQRVAFDAATSGAVIGRLEAKGWLIRVPDARDKRRKLLQLTPAGEVAAKAMIPDVKNVQVKLLAPLSKAEQKVFTALLKKIVMNTIKDH